MYHQGIMNMDIEQQIEELHEAACKASKPFYRDPQSGLMVMTAYALKQRPCCSSNCRHCPY